MRSCPAQTATAMRRRRGAEACRSRGARGSCCATGAGPAALVALRQLAAAREPPPVWVVVLCRGGHFAAAAFELRLPPKGAASRRGEECVKLLAHRCYHRYVTRRKAGGRQSVADASKTIKSAGS